MVHGWFDESFAFERMGEDWDWPNEEPEYRMLYAHLVRRTNRRAR